MTGYINWMAYTQASKDGTLPTEGNTISDYVTVASAGTSAAAPTGAQYATIVCSVASKVEANIISVSGVSDGDTIYSAKELYVAANVPVQIPNIVVGKTTLTVTDI